MIKLFFITLLFISHASMESSWLKTIFTCGKKQPQKGQLASCSSVPDTVITIANSNTQKEQKTLQELLDVNAPHNKELKEFLESILLHDVTMLIAEYCNDFDAYKTLQTNVIYDWPVMTSFSYKPVQSIKIAPDYSTVTAQVYDKSDDPMYKMTWDLKTDKFTEGKATCMLWKILIEPLPYSADGIQKNICIASPDNIMQATLTSNPDSKGSMMEDHISKHTVELKLNTGAFLKSLLKMSEKKELREKSGDTV